MINIQDVQLTDYGAHHVIEGINDSINKKFTVSETLETLIYPNSRRLYYTNEEFILQQYFISTNGFNEYDAIDYITNTIHSKIQSLIDYVTESIDNIDYKNKVGFVLLPYALQEEINCPNCVRINVTIHNLIIMLNAYRDPDVQKTQVTVGIAYFIPKDIGLGNVRPN